MNVEYYSNKYGMYYKIQYDTVYMWKVASPWQEHGWVMAYDVAPNPSPTDPEWVRSRPDVYKKISEEDLMLEML